LYHIVLEEILGIQERKWRKGRVLECMKREERRVEEEEGLTIEKKSEIEHNPKFGEYCLRGFEN